MKKRFLIFIITVVVFFIGVFNIKFYDDVKINIILESNSYDYLPDEAKDYVREVYDKTGEVIFTEKNKQDNKVYLNPQYIEYLTYSDEEKATLGEVPVSMIVDYSPKEEHKNLNVPSKFDLRDSYLTPVKDQGDLGVCWTFATAGVSEAYLFKTNSSITSENPKFISERQIDYVTAKDGLNDYKSEYVSFVDRELGSGGNFYISTIALANGVSLFDSTSFKEYNDADLQKMELSDVISHNKSEYEVNSTINMPRLGLRESTDELSDEQKEARDSYLQIVKYFIMEKGAAYVGTYMNSSCVYNDTKLGNIVLDVYNCSRSGSHAMQIIGWDDDLEYSYCADTSSHKSDTTNCKNIVSGKGVWILKNSWGEDDTPYPYLTYDSLYSSISFIDDMTSTRSKNWENNYIIGDGDYNISEATFNFSDTKIRGDEKLKKVKFIVDGTDTLYNVRVYKKDGTYEDFSNRSLLPGLITVDITGDVIIDKDSKIIVSSGSTYIDRVSVFTESVNNDPFIDMEEYDDLSISDIKFRMYSETKNIPSGTELIYKIYDSNNQEVTSVEFTNTVVAENNVNTLVKFGDLDSGTYRIDVIFNSEVISSINIKIVKMQGQGTASDPYVITTSTHLSQIRNDLDAYYVLGNDIDLSVDTREGGKLSVESTTCPQGYGWEAINNFTGYLDGKGYSIKGLYQNNYLTCDDDSTYNWNNLGNGLFGTTSGNVTIKNLVLEDFDVTCQGGYCGALISKYDAYNGNYDDQTEYTATFENIVLKNSVISGVYNGRNGDSSLRNSYGGGLFGFVESIYGNIVISNIFLDFKLDTAKGIEDTAYLATYVFAKNVTISDIQILGNQNGSNLDGFNSVLIYKPYAKDSFVVKNILSLEIGNNVGGTLFGDVWGTTSNYTFKDINTFKIGEKKFYKRFDGIDDATITNLNMYDKETELLKLTDKNNYPNFNFIGIWNIKTVDGIPRIPVLKIVDFEYTNISDISIKQKLNEHKSIYDYLTPNIDSAKRISFKSNNESIVKLDADGRIVPQATGNTTIHVESYYDGYIKDVPVSIEYVPHYTVYFDSNGGEGTMDMLEVAAREEQILPENKFTRVNYDFKEWNTKADGTGTSYSDFDTIPAMDDKEVLTLYAQWWGDEREVTFDPDGGEVEPKSKIVRLYGTYGELPLPTKEGCAFNGWYSSGTFVSAFTRLYGLELKAKWVENAYTIIYNANGGTILDSYKEERSINILSDTVATSYAVNGSSRILSKNIYSKQNYVFKEWNTKADGTGTAYSEEDTIQLSNVLDNTLNLYAIWEEDSNFEIKDYEYDEDNNTIFSIPARITKNEYLSKFVLGSSYTVEFDLESEYVSTGSKVRIYKNGELFKELTNIVVGDTNGDGTLSVLDIVKINNHIVDNSKKLTDIYALAGDYNSDGDLSVLDIVKINNVIIGGN